MPRSRTPIIRLEEMKARFEDWRQNRKGKAAILELWSAAVEVARKEGVSRTSTALRVEWNHLKGRMATTGAVSRQPATPAFIELVAPPARPQPECTVELEGRSASWWRSNLSTEGNTRRPLICGLPSRQDSENHLRFTGNHRPCVPGSA